MSRSYRAPVATPEPFYAPQHGPRGLAAGGALRRLNASRPMARDERAERLALHNHAYAAQRTHHAPRLIRRPAPSHVVCVSMSAFLSSTPVTDVTILDAPTRQGFDFDAAVARAMQEVPTQTQ